MRPSEPPPKLRPGLTESERLQITAVVGQLPDGLARALRDGRGRAFQRLEFLGDSVLDVMLATHAVVEPACSECIAVKGEVARLVTDVRLAKQAEAIGLGAWLEWDASPDRLADLVEACVAASWLNGGWGQAAGFASRTVHPLSDESVRTLGGHRELASDATGSRAERRAGAALLELAAAAAAFRGHPDADEGELSRLRADSHRTSRVAAHARRTGLVQGGGEDAAASDQVEAWLAGQLLHQGAAVALAGADVVLR